MLPALASAAASGAPHIVLDGSLGKGGPIQPINGTYNVSASLGTQSGPNLFQSFSQFNLSSGETASFSGPASVHNVLARVTDGTSSNIDGTLRCTIPGANFYLINPAGVVFGPDAALDVKGSFVVSTADYLRLGTAGRFDASVPQNAVLTSAPPSAFGFLSSPPQGVTIAGTRLAVPAGSALSVVSGPLQATGASLSAPSGHVNVVAVGAAGEVASDAGDTSATLARPASQSGAAILLDHTQIDVSGDGGGAVTILGGDLTLTSAGVTVGNVTVGGGRIDIFLGGALSASQSTIATSSLGAAPASSISVSAAMVSLSSSEILSQAVGTNAGSRSGDVKISAAGALTVTGGSLITSSANPPGSPGVLTIFAGSAAVAQASFIGNNPNSTAGVSGDVNVAVSGALSVSDGSTIGTAGGGTSAGHNVAVTAGQVSVSNFGGIGAVAGDARGGDVTLRVGSLSAGGGGSVYTNATGAGNAGTVSVTATGDIALSSGGTIQSSSVSSNGGAAGAVNVVADTLEVGAGSSVSSLTTANSSGPVTVSARQITLDATSAMGSSPGGPSGIFANSLSAGGAGQSADVSVTASQGITLSGPAAIASTCAAGGFPGTVSVTCANLSLLGGAAIGASDPNAQSLSGDISVSVSNAMMLSGATLGTANADLPGGNITIDTGQFSLDNRAAIQTASIGAGRGGTISVTATGAVSLSGGSSLSTSASGAGAGGDVKIAAGSLSVAGGSQVATTTSGSGAGGAVNVNAGPISVTAGGNVGSFTAGPGMAAPVNVTGKTIVIDDQNVSTSAFLSSTSIFSGTGGTGSAGAVSVTADAMKLLNGGSVSEQLLSAASGGSIKINAGQLLIDGGSGVFHSAITNLAGVSALGAAGDAGNISLDLTGVTIQNNGAISALTLGGGGGHIAVNASDIAVNSGGVIRADVLAPLPPGQAAGILVRTGTLSLDGGTLLTTNSAAGAGLDIDGHAARLSLSHGGAIDAVNVAAKPGGRGGNVNLTVQALDMTSGASITTLTAGPGDAGDVSIAASKARLHDLSAITSGPQNGLTQASGNGGSLSINANSLSVDRSVITAGSGGAGVGGDVSVNVDNLLLTRRGTISSASFSSGTSGGVVIHASRDVILQSRARINTSAAQAVGGPIDITAGDVMLSGGSSITAAASENDAGNISLAARDLFSLTNSQVTTQANGAGGNIRIDPSLVTLNASRVTADAINKNGGNIDIHPDFLLASTDSSITAFSRRAVSGTIALTPFDTEIARGLLPFTGSLTPRAALDDHCAALTLSGASSFVVTGSGGAPLEPGGFLSSDELRVPASASASNSGRAKTPRRQERQGE